MPGERRRNGICSISSRGEETACLAVLFLGDRQICPAVHLGQAAGPAQTTEQLDELGGGIGRDRRNEVIGTDGDRQELGLEGSQPRQQLSDWYGGSKSQTQCGRLGPTD